MNDQELVEKYGIGQPPQADHPTVTAILAAERTTARAGRLAGDTSCLFDHAHNPRLWELANETVQQMHRRYGDFMIGVWGEAVFLYYPGSEDFRAYGSDIERHAYMLNHHSRNGCEIRPAPRGCGGDTVFLPLQRGPFIVAFEVCGACEVWAWETAETNFRFNVLATRRPCRPGLIHSACVRGRVGAFAIHCRIQ